MGVGKGRLTNAQAAHNAQQGARHVVEREGQVDHVLLVGTTQLVEPLALQDLQVTDPSSLGEAWGETRGRAQRQARLPRPPAGFPTERGTEAKLRLRGEARLTWKGGKIGEVEK